MKMISKAFQNIVTQMADVFPKKFGIVDSHGLVLANNGGEPTGDIIENLVYAATNNDKLLFKDGYTVRSMSNKPYAEYVVYVEGTDEVSKYCCNSIVVAANNVRHYYDEKYDRNNFIKNVKEHRYDGLLFHRVIKQFMVQAGDINSKDAPMEQHLGDGDLDYTIPAEIVYPKYFHKRGMFAAARTGDEENPERASSATQFYIVTGKFFTEMELDKMEKEQGITFTPEQRQAYMLEGGTPHLDGKYTIFGEVVSGMKAVDKIQFTETNADDRPVKNIKIKSMKIVNK